uniref:Uncharacterized protein n=1 Tax=Timema genevievae TaxID=629358 RepID=A0A7R9PGW8_TIMGE|nr:unnamed protein product [Timema genevievae]
MFHRDSRCQDILLFYRDSRCRDILLFYRTHIMRLESWKQRWMGGSHAPASRSASIDTESEHDEPNDLQLQLNSEMSSPEV